MAWVDTLPDDLKAHVAAKGFDKKTDINEAVVEIVKAHQAAEKFVGVPAERLLRLPEKDDAPEWDEIRARLPKPKDAAAYALDEVKGGDDYKAFARTLSHELGLPQTQALRMAQAFAEYEVKNMKATEDAKLTTVSAEAAMLDAQWGGKKDVNLFLAKKGAEILGFSAEVVDALQGVSGYAKTMEALRLAGERSSEAPNLRGGSTGNGKPILSREEALQERERLKADGAWVKRWMEGDQEARKQILELDTVIVGPPPQGYMR